MIRGVYVNAVIIRFQDSFAVCRKDNKTIIEINKNLLPPGVKEGDVLEIAGSRISLNLIETRNRKNMLEDFFKEL